MSERLYVSGGHRQTWWVAVTSAAIGLPLVVIAPVVTVLLLIAVAGCAALMSARNERTATVLTAASVGLLITVTLYFGLAILR